MSKKYPKPRKWYPKNIGKYNGDVNNITIRSSWEAAFFNWCDLNSGVLSYESEETIIPYRCVTDNKIHRYFVDAKITIKTSDNSIKTYLQSIPPKKRNSKKYLSEVMTYGKNQSKWTAAKQYCLERGWEFIIITEKELFGKK